MRLPWGDVVPTWLGVLFWGIVGFDAVVLLVLVWLVVTELIGEWRYRR